MASLEEIYKEITDAFIEDDTVIAKYGLDTTKTFDEQFSKFAIERIIFYTVAFVIYTREKSLDKWLEDVEKTALATRYGTKQWWHKMALMWQYGDEAMVLDDGSIGYEEEDYGKRIIKYAALSCEGRTVYIKTAKLNTAGQLTVLSKDELNGFRSYVDKIKPVGISVVAQSIKGCGLQINGTVYYNGERKAEEILTEVKSAVKDYLNEIEFGGVLFKNKIIDVMQKIDGVTDVETDVLLYEDGEGVRKMGRSYVSKGGYYLMYAWGLRAVEEINNN